MEDRNPDPPIRDDGLPDVPSGYSPQPPLTDDEKRQLGIPVDAPGSEDSFDPSQHQALRHEWRASDSSADFEHYTVATAGDASTSADSAGLSDPHAVGSLSDSQSSEASDNVASALGSATESIDRLTDAIKSIHGNNSQTEPASSTSPLQVEDDRGDNDSASLARLNTPSVQDAETRTPSVSDAAESNADRPSLFDDPAWRELRDMAAQLSRAESSRDTSVSSAVEHQQSRRDQSDGVAPLISEDEPLVPQQESDATEIRRQYRRQNIQSAMYSASNVASGIANANTGSALGAGAAFSGLSGALSAGGSAVALGTGPVGIGLATAAGGAASALNAVMKSANNASASLAKYSGQMSIANANADIRKILGDVGRANTLAGGVSRYTDVTSKMSEMAQNAQAAFLKAALDKIVPALEAILAALEKYGPPMLNFFIDIMELLDGVIQSIPDLLGGIMPLKVISSGMLDAAKTLRELNERDKMKNLKDAEVFLDQFLSFGGMGIDPAWKGNNPPPNKHPVMNMDAKFNQLLNGGF